MVTSALRTCLFFYIYTICIRHSTKAFDTRFCSNRFSGLFPDQEDCNSYYQCFLIFTYHRPCPEGLWFHPLGHYCDYPANVPCIATPGATTPPRPPFDREFCRSRNTGIYPDPQDCTKFYQCADGHYTFSTLCPVSLHFDSVTLTCTYPDDALCISERAIVDPANLSVTSSLKTTIEPFTSIPSTKSTRETTATTQKTTTTSTTSTTFSTTPTTTSTMSTFPLTSSAPQTTTPRPVTPSPKESSCFKKVCYFTNWSQYRVDGAKFTTDNITTSLCTHIIYAFATLKDNRLKPFEWNDLSTEWMTGNYEKIMAKKSENKDLKILLAVGGWNVGSEPFSSMAASPSNRTEFVSTSIEFLREHEFDGLDLDWEYPTLRGGVPEDKERFTALVQELQKAFQAEASATGKERLLLSAAVAVGKTTADAAYDIPSISESLDMVNLMAYDLHGGWESKTGHNSPLYARADEKDAERWLNVDFVVQYWLDQGCPREKLILGIPMYGKSFTLTSSDTSVGAPATNGPRGPYTGELGFAAYYEVCDLIRNGANVFFIEEQQVPFLVSGNQWVGYDDPASVSRKAAYVRERGLGGAMVWSLDFDDFTGNFCGAGSYPLLNAINAGLQCEEGSLK